MQNFILYRKILDQLDTYVPGKPIAEVQKEYNLSTVIKLASNENPIGPSPSVMECIAAYGKKTRLYPDGNCSDLKNKLAQIYKMSPANFIIGNGSDEILMLIALAYVNKNDEVLISEQTFSEYLFTSKCMEAQIITVPQKNYRYDLEAFTTKITKKTKVIFICNPNNPTGTIITDNEFTSFMEKVPPHTLVLIDEAYYEYVTAKDYPDSTNYLTRYKNILITRTFSKIYGLAGLRIGYAIGDEQVISALNKVREPFNVNSIAQLAATIALNDQEHLSSIKTLNEKTKLYLYQELEKLNIPYIKSQANFVLFQPGGSAQSFFQKMMQKGIIVRAMTGFGLPDHVRVTTGNEDETREFIYKLKEII